MKIKQWFVLVAVVLSHQAGADEVIREVPDTAAGKGVGVLSGVMAGGATGGLVGALLGGAAGYLWAPRCSKRWGSQSVATT